MRKIIVLIIGLFVVNISAKAYRAGATFVAEPGNSIQVIIDGIVINNKPKHKVSIVGSSGEHEVSFRIFDTQGNVREGNTNCIHLKSGYKSFYEIVDSTLCNELIKVKMEPYSSKKFKNPDYYYNRNFYTSIRTKTSDNDCCITYVYKHHLCSIT